MQMMKNFDEFQKMGKEGMDATMEAFSAASKGAQTIATEVAEYARKSFEQSSAAAEKLMAARTLDRAVEIQSDYAKSAYEGFVSQAAKIGEIYVDLAKQSYKPFEGYSAKFGPNA
jgi:hypothetical protein